MTNQPLMQGGNNNPMLQMGPGGILSAPPMQPPQGNFQMANQQLQMTPQEQALYQRHLNNLYGGGGVNNPDGSRSTLYQLSFGSGGRIYNVPTVYGGSILSPDDAIARAHQIGLENFPSYGSQEEAEKRYNAMHDFMERDTAQYLRGNQFLRQMGSTP